MQNTEGEYEIMKSLFSNAGDSLGRNELAKIKTKALRRGLWFRVLTRPERSQMELTMRIVKRIRSLFLAKVVVGIVEKLLDAMENKVPRLTRIVGPALAHKLSETAQKWGNKSAFHWTDDLDFRRYLTVMYVNTPPMFKP